ncbi:hypothetical protein FHG87_021839 [Trinorchestia longiramus]|nr:hypothetical protein FHG87_021839 [Trinorchestia longiramus]
MAGGKSRKAGSRCIIECRTCEMWVDLESCKGLTEMSQSERNKLVFDCWKCTVDDREKMADVNMKKEAEIKWLKAEVVSTRRESEDGRKLKGEDVRSKRKVDGDVNDGVRCVSERDEQNRVNEKINGSWAKVNGRRMSEKNGINDNERNRINQKMNGPSIKMGGRRINEIDAMKGEHDRERRMQGRERRMRVALTSLLRRLACNEEYERLRKEVNRDLHEKILVMKAESIRKREVGSSFLDMDDLIQAGCFLRDEVHLSQEEETKLSQRFIRWISATHFLMEGRMD